MFNKSIVHPILASEEADKLFSNITATGTLDQSFLISMRMLLQKRLPQDDTAKLVCKCLFLSESELMSTPPSERMSLIMQNSFEYLTMRGHSICIIYPLEAGAGAAMLEVVKSNAGKGNRYLSDYTRRDDLQVFYARKAKALFYTNDSGRNTVIFAEKLELKQFHVLQMMLPKYLPSLFREHPLNEKEIALLKSTGNKSAVEFETLLDLFAKDLDIRAEIIRNKLSSFETAFERAKIENLQSEINSYQSSYEYYLSMMRDMANKIQESKYTLAGLEFAISEHSGDSELMEYFMCNKNLSLSKVRGTAIEFVAHGYADVYDEDAFERYVGNHGGSLYHYLSVSITKSQMEKLYRAIFSERKYKLRLCAAYRADICNGLQPIKNHVFPTESQTYLPNPHIQNHGCTGSYAGRFQEYMQRRDYVGAIEQTIVSARNLNFHDSVIIRTFARELSHSTINCIERPDGTLLTPQEAIIELEGNTSCQDPLP